MNSDFTEILGVQVSTLSKDVILEDVRKYLSQAPNSKHQIPKKTTKPLVIYTPNPEIVVYARKDEKFRSLVNTAQINLCDGWGLVWASQVLGKPRLKRITGADFAEKLVAVAADLGVTIGLIGGRPGVAVKALECLKKKYPGLKGWVEQGPAVGDYNNYNLYKKIGERKTGLVFVGLGCPKQEYFIEKIKNQKSKIKNKEPLLIMSVGGTFDYWAGKARRAPKFLQNLGLEWAWRLILEPWRLKRQLSLLKFVFFVYKERFKMV